MRHAVVTVVGLALAVLVGLASSTTGGETAQKDAVPAVPADIEPVEPEKGPDEAGTGRKPEVKNPLPEIIRLMRLVEQRLADAEADEFTQEHQRMILTALEAQQGVVDQLNKLIEEVESSPPQSGSGSGGEGSPQSSSGDEQERERQRQRERQRDRTSQSVDPQQSSQPKGGREDNQRQSESEKQRKREAGQRGESYQLEGGKTGGDAERWGDLPPKRAREVINARRREMPQRWRKRLEDYFQRLGEPRR